MLVHQPIQSCVSSADWSTHHGVVSDLLLLVLRVLGPLAVPEVLDLGEPRRHRAVPRREARRQVLPAQPVPVTYNQDFRFKTFGAKNGPTPTLLASRFWTLRSRLLVKGVWSMP